MAEISFVEGENNMSQPDQSSADISGVPDGLVDLLVDFTMAVLRDKPENCESYAASYFTPTGPQSRRGSAAGSAISTGESPQIPPGLVDMLVGFAVAVLRNSPSDVYEYAHLYFNNKLDKNAGAAVDDAVQETMLKSLDIANMVEMIYNRDQKNDMVFMTDGEAESSVPKVSTKGPAEENPFSGLMKLLIFFVLLMAVVDSIITIVTALFIIGNDYELIDSYKETPVDSLAHNLLFWPLVMLVLALVCLVMVIKGNAKFVMIYAIICFLMLIPFIVVVAVADSNSGDVLEDVPVFLYERIAETGTDKTREAWDDLQYRRECCGVYSKDDWASVGRTVPDSCCVYVNDLTGECVTVVDAPYHATGCQQVVRQTAEEQLGTIVAFGGIGIFVLAANALGCLAIVTIVNIRESKSD